MIHYHGLPITPEVAAKAAIDGGHAFVSFRTPGQLPTVIECCQSFAIDNGAFAAWSEGSPITDWAPFYTWAADCLLVPSCDFAVIPDVIDGTEEQNDDLVREWPLAKHQGAPVWHLHESLERLERLVSTWPRVCLGSSGEYATPGSPSWEQRMALAMSVVCDSQGRPATRLHGLRMLSTKVFTRFPLASADSTNIGRNIGIDSRWTGSYAPVGEAKKSVRAALLRSRIEAYNSPARWAAQT